MTYERDEAMRQQEATEAMIRMREPISPHPRPLADIEQGAWGDTDAERKQILDQRDNEARQRYAVGGAFAAADYLRDLGAQCCGGAGDQINPKTALPYGEPFFLAERMIRQWAATWKPTV